MAIAPPANAVRSIPDSRPPDERTLGWSILAWAAEYLVQPDGPDAGLPWVFTNEQVNIVLRWYEIDERGRFVWRRGVLRRMKGWGKDPFFAALALAEMCGPCRFGGWDAGGFPVAVTHPAPWIQAAAVTITQTRNTMLLFPGMLTSNAIDVYGLDLGKEIIYSAAGGQIQAVTSSPKALEGNRATLIGANETHLWVEANQGLAMAQVIKRNLAKARDGAGRVLELTNAHQPNEESSAEDTYEAWRAGKLKGVYYDSIEAPPIDDIYADEDELKLGLLAARGDSTWLDIERLSEEIHDPVTPEWESRRYYLNQVVRVGAEDWIDPAIWEERKLPREIPKGAQVILGFDGSFNFDTTAIVAVEIGEVPHVQVVALWEKPEFADDDWTVPIEDVEDRIRECCRLWKVREIDADPYRWERSLQILAKERLPVVEFPQRPARMIPATTRFFEAVVNGMLTHSGDPRLTRHIANCVLRVTSAGGQLSKDAKQSPRKIDLAVAAVMAYATAAAYRRPVATVIDLNSLRAEMTFEELTPLDPFDLTEDPDGEDDA